MDLFEIDRQSCNKDGICAAVCPAGIIHFKKGEYPVPVPRAGEFCIRCGHCVAVCPTASLNHREMSAENCPPINKDLYLTADQCEQFLRARRSIRAYKEKSVPEKEISKLIDLARYAPTAHNSQSVEWLVLADKDELKHLTGIIVEWMRWMKDNMPEIAASFNMDGMISQWKKGKDVLLRDAPVVIVTHAAKNDLAARTSSTLALSYLELAAASAGLGCCWAGLFQAAAAKFPPMIEALQLPEGHESMGAMMLGYPRFGYQRLPLRKNPKITWRLKSY